MHVDSSSIITIQMKFVGIYIESFLPSPWNLDLRCCRRRCSSHIHMFFVMRAFCGNHACRSYSWCLWWKWLFDRCELRPLLTKWGRVREMLGIYRGSWLTICLFCLLGFSADMHIIFVFKLLGVKSCTGPLTEFMKPRPKYLSFIIQQVQKQVVVHTEFCQSMPVSHCEKQFHHRRIMGLWEKPIKNRYSTLTLTE